MERNKDNQETIDRSTRKKTTNNILEEKVHIQDSNNAVPIVTKHAMNEDEMSD